MSPWVVWTAVTRPLEISKPVTSTLPKNDRAVSLGLSRHRLGRPGRLRVDVRRDVDRPQGALGEHREEVPRLGGAENVGLDAPATAVPSLSFQIGEPLRRPGHLQAAHGLGARNAVEFQPRPQVDGVASEARHRLGGVDLEDEARGVGRGAAGLEERALVDDDDVPPPKLCQVVCDAATGDPRANDDHSGAPRNRTDRHLACPLDETKPVQVTRCYHGGGGYGCADRWINKASKASTTRVASCQHNGSCQQSGRLSRLSEQEELGSVRKYLPVRLFTT